MVEIRDMASADWAEVAAIYSAGLDTNNATFETVCPDYSQWSAAHIECCRLVAVDGIQIVGWAALSPVSDRSVYDGVAEVSIYLAPDSQGKGIGTQLLKQLIADSEQAGFWTLQAGILPENTASIKLHETCGFRLVGRRERIGKDRFGVWRDTLLMERRSTQQ